MFDLTGKRALVTGASGGMSVARKSVIRFFVSATRKSDKKPMPYKVGV